jgi:4-hydroxyphenylpyruvate dioxygenase
MRDEKTFLESTQQEAVQAFDSIELYVGNAHQAAHYFQRCFGFAAAQQSGPETGSKDAATFLVTEGDIRLLLTSGLTPGPIRDFVHRHGDSVRDIALSVGDVDATFQHATKNGATPVMEPCTFQTGEYQVKKAVVGTPGDIVHTLVERQPHVPWVLPNGKNLRKGNHSFTANMIAVDHLALAVPKGELTRWVEFYRSAFDFDLSYQELTSTEFSAMRSMVVENKNRTVKLVILEPAEGRKRSQIEDFLQHHNGSGVQHLAVLCADIGLRVKELRAQGVELLDIPDSYYDMLPSRFNGLLENVEQLRELRILVDRDEWGELMQTFSKPITGRPTLFVELVQRNGARGFGTNNIRALFEAVERSQVVAVGR